jgi:SAM-dependent methyltransferase
MITPPLPRDRRIDRIIYSIFGYPNAMRRVQYPVLFRFLDVQPGEYIADLGCGDGAFAWAIAQRTRCIGLDIDLQPYHAFLASQSTQLTFTQGSVEQLPFPDHTFDKVLLSSVLQMVRDDRAALKEIYRVLKPHGTLVLSAPVDGFRFFPSLNTRLSALRQGFGSSGRTNYPRPDLESLIKESGFSIQKSECAPKVVGSFIFELQLVIANMLHLPLSKPAYFPLMYPFFLLDRLFPAAARGDEVIIQAMRQ